MEDGAMKLDDMKVVAVIGAGDMGHGIAQLALMAGYEVHLSDLKEEVVQNGIAKIFASLEKLISKGRCATEVLEGAKAGKIKGYTNTAEASKDADMVVEVVAENMAVKKIVLSAISDAVRPDAIIASNTSTMSITTLSGFVKNPGRFVGMHYFNPAVLMKLVEVVRGEHTTDETAELALAYVQKIGKISVYARKDTPGFIANRINIPAVLYNGMCMDIDGIAAQDIDASMMQVGLKMGPMELLDYTGVDVISDCMAYYHAHLSEEYRASNAVCELVANHKFGKKTGEGFYQWVDGKRPVIDPSAITGRYSTELYFLIEANEACKLYEEGVCSLEDCDKAMQLGYNTPGPIGYIQDKDPAYVADALNRIAERFSCEVFRPTETICQGAYKKEA